MGGHINVEIEPEQGTSFIIQLPIYEGPTDVTTLRLSQRMEIKQGKILIVEDEDIVREFLADFIAEDHELDAFATGEDLLRDFEDGRYQVAFIDLGMPGMAGDQVALALKKRDPTHVTVLMTGWRLEDNNARLLPFDFRIDKPFSNEEALREIIQQSLIHYQKRKQA